METSLRIEDLKDKTTNEHRSISTHNINKHGFNTEVSSLMVSSDGR